MSVFTSRNYMNETKALCLSVQYEIKKFLREKYKLLPRHSAGKLHKGRKDTRNEYKGKFTLF